MKPSSQEKEWQNAGGASGEIEASTPNLPPDSEARVPLESARGRIDRPIRRPRVGRTVPVSRRFVGRGPEPAPPAAIRPHGSAGTPRPTFVEPRGDIRRHVRSPPGRANRPGEPTIAGRGPESDTPAAIRADGSAGTPRPTCGSRTAWRHSQARSSPEGRANRPGEPPFVGRGSNSTRPRRFARRRSAGTPRPTRDSRTAWRHPQARSRPALRTDHPVQRERALRAAFPSGLPDRPPGRDAPRSPPSSAGGRCAQRRRARWRISPRRRR